MLGRGVSVLNRQTLQRAGLQGIAVHRDSLLSKVERPITRLTEYYPLAMASRASSSSSAPPGYKVDQSAGKMMRFQESLPNLPVPTLEETMPKLLKSVRALARDDGEFGQTEQAVKEFMASGQSKELQKRLLEHKEREEREGRQNWFAEWWNHVAYMAPRDSVAVNVSYFFAFADDQSRMEPARRAASIVTAALEFRRMVEGKELEPEYVKGLPMSMESYDWMFHACRYPKKGADTAEKFDPSRHDHIAVVRKNKFWKVPLDVQGRQVSTKELEVQFRRIIDMSGPIPGPSVGVLTAENRDTWADARQELSFASEVNQNSLKDIETSAFVVCLDDTTPITHDEHSRGCWIGDGRNRFWDKSLQFIVFDNGKAGFCGEHSCMDGTPTARLNDFILTMLAKNKINHGTGTLDNDNLPDPQPLPFVLPPLLKRSIAIGEVNFDAMVAKEDLNVLYYQGYGKNLIKASKCSPDGWVQMLIQLAYYKTWGKACGTYESAQTRKFKRGRTEVVRTTCLESVAWTRAMEDPNCSNKERIKLFREAVKAHGQYMADATEGKGIDRHIFGLKRVLKEGEEVPALFKDKLLATSSTWHISSSQLASNYFDGCEWVRPG